MVDIHLLLVFLESLPSRALLILDFDTNPQVGLVLDMGIEEELIHRHLQVADATRATLGLPVLEYTITDAPLQVSLPEVAYILDIALISNSEFLKVVLLVS